MDEIQPQKNDKKFSIFLAILLAFILIIAVVLFAFSNGIFVDNNNIPTYTKIFTNVTAKEAYDLINTTENLTIIDCRGLDSGITCSDCTFKAGHLPGAERNINPLTLFNTTNDILIYSKNGTESEEFCSQLVNNVYGKIYNLIGGYYAWAAAKYPYETGLEK